MFWRGGFCPVGEMFLLWMLFVWRYLKSGCFEEMLRGCFFPGCFGGFHVLVVILKLFSSFEMVCSLLLFCCALQDCILKHSSVDFSTQCVFIEYQIVSVPRVSKGCYLVRFEY